MSNKPHRDPRLLEAIDACRPGSDDVSDPALDFLLPELAASAELGELYERCQRLDGRVAAAFQDVPVPEGLSGRILARLQEAGPDAPAAAASAPGPVAATPRRVGRRWFAVAAVTASVAASLVIAVVQFDRPAPLTAEQAQSAALNFGMAEAQELFGSGEWLTAQNEPAEFPYSRSLRQFRGTSYRRVAGFLGREGVAYDLTNNFGTTATLYVVRAHEPGASPPADDLPDEPPVFARTSYGTGGCRAAAWHSGGLLYVLVVHSESKRAYDQFVMPPGAVT